MRNKFFNKFVESLKEKPMKPHERWAKKVAGKKKVEAQSVSSSPELVRGAPVANFESDKPKSIKARFMESDKPNGDVFEVVLIEEGLGNLGDRYYYSKEALKSAVPLFEGKKIYADHPSRIDEESRPERSVRDVIGHFEGVTYVESDGRGQLKAKSHVLGGESYAWARELMRQAVAYSQKYPDKNFIGLSINAGGDSQNLPIDKIYESTSVPSSAKAKIEMAKKEGVDTIRLVTKIDQAISCDLVTEPGAGGRVTSVLTGE